MTHHAAQIVQHHLRLLGLPDSVPYAVLPPTTDCSTEQVQQARAAHLAAVRAGLTLLAVQPDPTWLADLGVTAGPVMPPGTRLKRQICSAPWHQEPLRSLHPVQTYQATHGACWVSDAGGRPVWLSLSLGAGHIILIGNALADDLIRFRQGDPTQAVQRPTDIQWGIAGERPNYLFDAQIPEGTERDRPADWWASTLAELVAACVNHTLPPLLPRGAPGALVITGDDDQAFLEKYDEQLQTLNGLPITYFLHPLTRHTPETLGRIRKHHHVELGLHPDALEEPARYHALCREQAQWFEKLTGHPARSVRNHGFLNDGYWGHLPVWRELGMNASSNLPGLNGKVLNGSLLPARVTINQQLTEHWSILTTIGDGVRFALGLDGPASGQCVLDCGERMLQSQLPGVIVLNLHPQNIVEAREMHQALHTLVQRGFVAMTLNDCIAWFTRRDQGDYREPVPPSRNRWQRLWQTWRPKSRTSAPRHPAYPF